MTDDNKKQNKELTKSNSKTAIKSKNDVREPGMYHVVFVNDDFTPMDFVVKLLMEIFYHDSDTAEELTKLIHDKGKGVAGPYSYEIAEQKSIESTSMARTAGHPLQVTIEKE